MYFIIETKEQLDNLPKSDVCFIQLIPSSDKCHPELSRCSLVYYNDGTKGYILSVNHSEGFSLEVAQIECFINCHKKVYLLDYKFHSYFLNLENVIDLQFTRVEQGIDSSKLEYSTILHREFNSRLRQLDSINEIIPITKHYERCENLYNKVQSLIDLENDYSILNKISLLYKWVEKSGICINQKLFEKVYGIEDSRVFIKSRLAYSYYNMYNTTGRPTNSYNGINFVAIPKNKEFRDCFIPRYDYLIEFDFDSYHLRLIAKQINYQFEDTQESIHAQLGKIYFNKSNLTEEEYNKSKEITFRQLYGGIEDKYKKHLFFSSLDNFINKIWAKYKKQGSITLPTGIMLKRDSEITALKLFNYWIQNLETRVNSYKIEKLREMMQNYKSKLVLITYDSFLFDYSIEDGKEFLIKVKQILEEGEFKVKHRHSKTYFFN
jgi:hypothetical protein